MRLRQDLGPALRSGITFGAALVLVLEVGLAVFANDQMALYATRFVSSIAIDGVPLLSNWFVLIMAAYVTAFGLRRVIFHRTNST